jgi:hypothetical protein
MKFVCALGMVLMTCWPLVQAQDSQSGVPEGYIALLRSDVKAKKTDIIQQNLTLTEDQAKKFWPIQRSYETDLSKLGDQRLETIREYAKNWDTLTDDQAKSLGKRTFDFQKKRVDLRNKYFDQISKQVSPTIAAKYMQIEIQMENLIDLSIASQIPLIK